MLVHNIILYILHDIVFRLQTFYCDVFNLLDVYNLSKTLVQNVKSNIINKKELINEQILSKIKCKLKQETKDGTR